MNLNQSIGSIVAEDYRTAVVFSRMGIDFCCKGNRSISEVCAEKGVKPDVLVEALWEARLGPEHPLDRSVREWSASELAEYIEKQHHRYVRETAPILVTYLTKVAAVHGSRHPELQRILELFIESTDDLLEHVREEERVLFPAVKRMERTAAIGSTLDKPFSFGKVEDLITTMLEEHEAEGSRFAEMAVLSDNYTPPEDACNTYRVAFAKLREFETDLHRHIHLENNILFHKAIELQKQLRENEAEFAG